MAEKIKILFLIDYFHRTGGTERHLAHLVRSLPRDAFECTIVVFDMGENSLLDEVREAGIPVIHFSVAREYTPFALVKAIALARLIRSTKADIVQTFHQKSDTYGALIARLSGVEHIVSSKRDIGELKRPRHFFLNRRLRFLFERVIVVADAVAKIVLAKEQVDPDRIVKIYNGVDQTSFVPPTDAERSLERQRLGILPDDFVAGMVAGFRPEKNHDVLFDGAMRAVESIPRLKLLLLGAGPLLESYRAKFSGTEFGERIIFAGDVTDVPRYLRAMDVGCLIPGSNEGFSNSVVEKMAMGLPMIVSDVGGNAEAIEHGASGFVIPPRDAEAFASALIEIYQNPNRRRDMGVRSRQLVEQKFTLDRMVDMHQILYRALLRSPLAHDRVDVRASSNCSGSVR